MRKRPELLAPAGNFEKLKTAILYGADAVYLSGQNFGMRAYAGNFSEQELAEARRLCSEKNVKMYVTVNIIAKNRDISGIEDHLAFINNLKADAVIISDLGIIDLCLKKFPELPVHVSTQFSAMNYLTVDFLYRTGAKRIILPRELSLSEIKEISSNSEAEIEIFVHGAMCMAYSGRCMLSYYTKQRDPNRGECNQTCRFKYHLTSPDIPEGLYVEEESGKGSYFFNSRDLCLIDHVPDIIESGVSSLKIEGRMKTSGYLATVVKTYREAIDRYFSGKDEYKTDPAWKKELCKVSNREYTSFRFRDPDIPADQNYDSGKALSTHDIAGTVKDIVKNKHLVVEVKSAFHPGQKLEIVVPGKRTINVVLEEIHDTALEKVSRTKPNQIVLIKYFKSVVPGSVIRVKK